MTGSDSIRRPAAPQPLRRGNYILANCAEFIATILRAPRATSGTSILVPAWRRSGMWVAIGAVAIVVSMFVVDAAALTAVAGLPPGVRLAFSKITDFGLSGWFLIPLGILLMALAILDRPWLQRWSRLVLAVLAVRLGFLFVAIAIPGILNNILKRLIGRARPSQLGPFFYEPLAWRAAFEGMPSGHATTAFSVLVAFGAMFPRLRWLFWIYALAIAASRVVVGAHYPSDVLAGAALGAVGALCIRDWFARRRLGFLVGPDGQIRPLPGPSTARLKGVARRLFAP